MCVCVCVWRGGWVGVGGNTTQEALESAAAQIDHG